MPDDKGIYYPTFWMRPDLDLTLIFDEAHFLHPNIGYKGFFDSRNSHVVLFQILI